MKYKNRDVSDEEEYSHTETLSDTEEFISVEENNGVNTIQLYLRGEEQPFATNADGGQFLFDELLDIKQVVYRDMAKYTIESTDYWEGVDYSAFHADGKLNIILVYLDETADKYVFNESWYDLVNNNEEFRKKMADYLIQKNENEAPYVHDWLTGHLTEMINTSEAVENKVPFDLSEIVAVWGSRAEKKKYQVAALVGYQVIDADDNVPKGRKKNEVFRNVQEALNVLDKAKTNKPTAGYYLYPVYENEIPDISFI